jgi:hypothetical protein
MSELNEERNHGQRFGKVIELDVSHDSSNKRIYSPLIISQTAV